MPSFSARKPLTVFVCVILVITLGVISFTKMQSTLLPEFELPYVVAYATYPGAGPEKVELAVTKPLESALSSVGGLESISSVSSDSLSLIIMQFAYSTNMDSALIEMNSSIDMIEGYLDESVSSPMLMQIDPDMLPVIVAAVSVDGMDAAAASEYVSDTVLPALERVDGVADVSATGLVRSTVRVEFDEAKLAALQKRFDDGVTDKFTDAYAELDDAGKEIADGIIELDDAQKELDDGRKKADNEFYKQQKELREARTQLEDGIAQIDGALAYIDAGVAPESGRAELMTQKAALTAQLEQLAEGEAALKSAKRETYKKLDDAQAQLDDARAQLDDAKAQLDDGQEELDTALSDALEAVNVKKMITSSMLSGIITANNLSLPAGYVVEDGEQLSVRVGNAFSSLDELTSLVLFENETVGAVRVGDVASVTLTDDALDNYARINGQDGILITVNKQSSASTTTVSSDLRDAIEKLTSNGDGVNATVLSDQGVYIEIVVQSVLENLLMGAALAIIILLLFLRSGRATFIVAVSIPVSLLLAVTLMYFSKISLNLISLCGLAMGVGMLVDNSIVVIENIYRLRAEGMSPVRAAVAGAREVGGAITASTLTTVCVFAPILFTEGLSRELFMDMGLTIAFSLAASLIVAMTFVPAASSMMLAKQVKSETKLFSKFINLYERTLRFTLKYKAVVLLLAVALLGLSVYGALTSGTAFLPESDSLQLIVSATVDDDVSAEDARATMDEAARRMLELEGISDVGVMEGGMSFMSMNGGGSSSNSYSIYAVLSGGKRPSSGELTAGILEVTADLPCEISVMSGSMDITSLMGSGISIDIRGPGLDELRTLARGVAEALSGVEGLATVNDGIGETSVEYAFAVDKQKAMGYGLTVAQVYSAVSDALATETSSASVTLDGVNANVVIVKSPADAYTSQTLPELELDGAKDGESFAVRLGDIADFFVGESAQSIRREGGSRVISVQASVAAGYNIGLVSRDVEQALATFELPEDYTMEISGENATINDTLSDLIEMTLLALLLIYLIMVAQFQSLLSPFIVMFTIPLAFTGGFLLQWICGFEVSVISMLGLLVLFGVVVNNGIVFVDCANGLYLPGTDRREALVTAGRRRMRPILMTALTTILALVTMCLGLGTGADIIQPMAVVLAGGLAYSTLLTLYVVPALYDIFHKKPTRQADTGEDK